MVIDRVISTLFPTLLLEGTSWLALWKEKERGDFLRFGRIIFSLIAIAFVANYFFFDRAVGLEPKSLWLTLRFSMAALALSVSAFYFSRLAERVTYYKFPALLAGIVFCYFQGRVLVWYSPEIYVYVYAFVIICAAILRTSLFLSMLFGVVLLAMVWPSFLEAGIDAPLAASGSIVSLVAIVLLRSGYAAEVRHFCAQQANLESQKKIIELTIEFSDRLRTFLPKEITLRMDEHVRARQMGIFQAAEEVMRPRTMEVSCLFSDIRGFTKSTKNFDGFVVDGVLPNVKECARVVEEERGIPRKIGDLIFAYFDLPDREESLLHCVRAAARVIDQNRISNNLSKKVAIARHVLVASGKAVVGNLGGFDSSVEITALGDPVNFLARLDEATKHEAIAKLMRGNEIILDSESATRISARLPSLEMEELELSKLGVQIRDFNEVTSVYMLRLSSSNREILQIQSDVHLEGELASKWDPRYESALSY